MLPFSFQLIKVNHEWDAQYRTLNDFFRSEVRSRDESFHKLQRQLSQEHHKVHGSVKELLDQKDSVIEEQSTKIRQLKDELARVTLESSQVLMRRIESDTEKKYQHAKRMFHELKKDNDIMKRREEVAGNFNEHLTLPLYCIAQPFTLLRIRQAEV